MEVGVLGSSLGLPRLSLLVGKNTGGESGSVVASETNKHDSNFWDLCFSLDLVLDVLDNLGVGSLVPHWNFLLVGGFDGWSLVDLHLKVGVLRE